MYKAVPFITIKHIYCAVLKKSHFIRVYIGSVCASFEKAIVVGPFGLVMSSAVIKYKNDVE